MNSLRRPARTSRVKAQGLSTSEQGDLFQQLDEQPAQPTNLDIHLELLGALKHALKEASRRGMSRPRVVERMNKLLADPDLPKADQVSVTDRQLNSWTAPSQDYKEFPARYLAAFCAATDCDLPLRVMAQNLGLDLIDRDELKKVRLGETIIQGARLKHEQRDLIRSLGT